MLRAPAAINSVALDSLLNQRSVSRAADCLNMTQPAMSNALARLHTYFGDELLVRIGRQLVLTPRAESLKDAVRDLLVRVEWTIATTSPFDPARSGREFNVLVSDYTLVTLLPNLLALARQQSANVRFNFLQQVSPPEKSLDRWPTHASRKASPSEPRSEPQPPVEAVSLPRPLFGIEHRWELN
jgi:LysR family transcriptional regulator, nod-box dependent transcriptional activator